MRLAKVCLCVLFVTLFLGVSNAQASVLPKDLPKPKCHFLYDGKLKGQKLWRHWIWHLDRAEYKRICNAISGESCWRPRAGAGTAYQGLCQWNWRWFKGVYWRFKFNPLNPVICIRMMIYNIKHPGKYGGWSNWAGH